jgi:shikimate kinase
MRTVALMGLRGSGKSTIGPMVSIRLGLPFKDLDPIVLARNRLRAVRDVVDTQGWPAFRAMEREALDAVLGGETCVLALGGGTATDAGSRRILDTWQTAGGLRLIYLRAQPETLKPRISRSDNRPSLTGGDPIKEFDRVFAERDPLYREIADRVIETDVMSVDELIDAVVAASA